MPIKYRLRESLIRSQFLSSIEVPVAKPKICVCNPAVIPLLQTSLLLMLIEGADAVGGSLSVTTVEETVVFESAPRATSFHIIELNPIKATIKIRNTNSLIYIYQLWKLGIVCSSIYMKETFCYTSGPPFF